MKKETLTVKTDKFGKITYRNLDDQLHNSHGPAIAYANGHKEYWINGKRHNPDGPAIAWADGSKSYYINDKKLSEAKFKTWQNQQSAPLHNKTAIIDGIKYTLKAN